MLIEIEITVSDIQRKNNQFAEEIILLQHRDKVDQQEAGIEELYNLQDKLDQYTRKQSLEIHGILESVYSSTEEAVTG